ncbi:MAG: hypothetical protein AB2L21_02860 [Anaerolineaceae bacterium]|jgi:hypothetical protein
MQKKLLLIVVLSLLGAGLVQTSTDGSAGEPKVLSSCTYSGCYGYYPPSQDCSGTTIASRFILLPDNVGLSELRVSTTCHAYWARASLSANNYYLASTIDGQGSVTDFSESSAYPLSAGDQLYTRMQSSTTSSRACGTAKSSSYISIPTYSYCTIFFVNN